MVNEFVRAVAVVSTAECLLVDRPLENNACVVIVVVTGLLEALENEPDLIGDVLRDLGLVLVKLDNISFVALGMENSSHFLAAVTTPVVARLVEEDKAGEEVEDVDDDDFLDVFVLALNQ